MPVLLEISIEEAEALQKRLTFAGSMTAAECDAVSAFEAKLAQGIKVERGPGGSEADMERVAESLVGKKVRLRVDTGTVYTGELEEIVGFRSLRVRMGNLTKPISLSRVVELEGEKAAA